MSSEFLIALLDQLQFGEITKVWIVFHKQQIDRKEDSDGRRVITNRVVQYMWKDENVSKIREFTDWRYVDEARIEWGNAKSMSISDCLTKLDFYGFNGLPVDIKTLPGERPHKIVLNL